MITIIEDRQYNDFSCDFTKVPHIQSILSLIEKQNIQKSIWNFEYAAVNYLKPDTESFTNLEDYEECVDLDLLADTIENSKVIILCGSNINKLVLGLSLKDNLLKVTKAFDRIFISYYSCFYSYKNNKPIEKALELAVNKHKEKITPPIEYEVISDLNRFDEVIEQLKNCSHLSFDFETNLIEAGRLIEYATMLSISARLGYSYIIPFEHKEPIYYEGKILDYEDPIFSDDELNYIIQKLTTYIFSNNKIVKIGQNTKFDMKVLLGYGIGLSQDFDSWEDIGLMAHILDERDRTSLSEQIIKNIPYYEDYKENVDYLGPLEQLAYYAARDTDSTLMLYYIHLKALKKDHELFNYYKKITRKALLVFTDVEYRGASIDSARAIKYYKDTEKLLAERKQKLADFPEYKKFVKMENLNKISKRIEELKLKIPTAKASYKARYEQELIDLTTGKITLYEEVNFASNTQLPKLIYSAEGFNIKHLKIKGKLVYSTGKEILDELNHPFTNQLSALRTLEKINGTYLSTLKDNAIDGCIHASFKINGTVTGRLSCTGPNLQNIMGRLSYEDAEVEALLKNIKKCFVPPKDYFILQVDGSQAELRFIANFSKDPVMIDAYLNNKDLHAITGANIMGLSFEDFMVSQHYKEGRWVGKSANFGIVYDISPEGYIAYIKNNTGKVISKTTAQEHIDKFFNTYTTLRKWHNRYKIMAKKYNYVKTMLGRRRRFSNINNTTNEGLINKDIRDAINSPIQGSSGEWFIALMIEYYKENLWMWNNIHDAIYFYIPKEKKEAIRQLKLIEEIALKPPFMQEFGITEEDMPVPILLDYSVSTDSWGECVELGKIDKVINWIENGFE